MSDTVVRLDFFAAEFTVAHEHHVRGNAPGGVVRYPGARRDGGRDGIWRIGGEVLLRMHGPQRVTVDLAEGALEVEDEPR